MRILGFEITRKSWASSPVGGGWFSWVQEGDTGAWQRNEKWKVGTILQYPPVYACVTLIASDVAKLAPMLKKKIAAHKIWEEHSDAKYNGVINRPNHYQNHIQFKEWWITSKLIRGNTFALKQRNNRGFVTAVYILDPGRVLPLVTPTGQVLYQLATDHLNSIEDASITVPASEIMHDRVNPLFHPLVGISPLFAAGDAGEHGRKIIKDSSKFFSNGARPGGVLTAPGSISDEVANRLKGEWQEGYTGENSGRVAVLGDGLKFESMRMTSTDAQLIEQLKWSAEAVCSAFHVPAYKIGVGQMPTRDNVEALTKDYYSQCLQKHIEDYEACWDEGLELPDNLCVELDLDALFRMDTKTQMESLGIGVDKALMAPNEGRRRLNLRPLIGGDTVYMQQQNYSLEALNERDKTNPLSEAPQEIDETDKALAVLWKKSPEKLHA